MISVTKDKDAGYEVLLRTIMKPVKEPKDPQYLIETVRTFQGPVPDLSNISEDGKQWLVGLLEGDGSVSVQSLSLYQKGSQLLEFVQNLVQGGTLSLGKRNCNGLRFSGLERYSPILEILKDYVVTPHWVERLNRLTRPSFVEHDPTIPWICGFFDAEGCVVLNGPSINMRIVQKDTKVLEKVQLVVGGTLSGVELNLRKEESRSFIPFYIKYGHNAEKLAKVAAAL